MSECRRLRWSLGAGPPRGMRSVVGDGWLLSVDAGVGLLWVHGVRGGVCAVQVVLPDVGASLGEQGSEPFLDASDEHGGRGAG